MQHLYASCALFHLLRLAVTLSMVNAIFPSASFAQRGRVNTGSAVAGGPASWTIPEPFASKLDAATLFGPSQVALFSGNQMMVYAPGGEAEQPVPITKIAGWPIGATGVDAACPYGASKLLLITGTRALEYDLPTAAITAQFNWPLPGGWQYVDGAVDWGGSQILVTYGLQYAIFDASTGAFSQPASLAWSGWPQAWNDGIDDVLNINDGQFYFLRGGEVISYNPQTSAFAGPPAKIASSVAAVKKPEVPWCLIANPENPGFGQLTDAKTQAAGGAAGNDQVIKLNRGSRVAEVQVYGAWMISGLAFVTETSDGRRTTSTVFGRASGLPKVFALQPDECITGFSGAYGGSSGDYIYTLQVRTNKSTSPMFGGQGAGSGNNKFEVLIPYEGSFSGVFGKTSDYVSNIGVLYAHYADPLAAAGTGGADVEEEQSSTPTKKPAGGAGRSDDFEDGMMEPGSEMDRGEFPAKDWFGVSLDILYLDAMKPVQTRKAPKNALVLVASKEGIGPKKWHIPHGSRYTTKATYGSSEFDKTVSNMAEYSKMWEVHGSASVDAGGLVGGAGGSLSASYQSMNTSSFGSETKYYIQTAKSEYFGIWLDLTWQDDISGDFKRQKLTSHFRAAILALSAPETRVPTFSTDEQRRGAELPAGLQRYKETYQKIIDAYGTHFTDSVTYGGRYIKKVESKSNWSSMSKETIAKADVEVRARYGGFGAHVSGSVSVGGTMQNSSSNSNFSITTTVTTEATGGSGTEYTTWERSVVDQPAPVTLGVKPLTVLLNKEFFPEDPDIEKKQAIMRAVMVQHLIDKAGLPKGPVGGGSARPPSWWGAAGVR